MKCHIFTNFRSLVFADKSLSNKRHLRADGLPLRPSALRPRLLCYVLAISMVVCCVPVYADNSEDHNPSTNPTGDTQQSAKETETGLKPVVSGSSDGTATLDDESPSLTLSIPANPLSLELQPNSTFTKSSANSISVKTTSSGGYTLSIKAKSNNDLVSGDKKIASISNNLTEEQYQAEGNINTWGYQPSKFNNSDNTTFLPGPTTENSIIEKTSTATSVDSGNSYNFVLGAKVDNTLEQGNYSNTFIFTVTTNAIPYSITYELNSGSWTGTSPQTGTTTEGSITLSNVTPTRSNYEFKGWCDQQTSNDSCSGTTYQPGNPFPVSDGNNDVTLYAMWKSITYTYTINFETYGGTYPFSSVGQQNKTLTGTTTSNSYYINHIYNAYKKNYLIKGWCTSPTNGGNSCSGTAITVYWSYAYGNVTLNPGNNNITLYAMYEYTTYTDMTDLNCSSVSRSVTVSYNGVTGSIDKDGSLCVSDTYDDFYGTGAFNYDDAMKICPSGWRPFSSTSEYLNWASQHAGNGNAWIQNSASGSNAMFCNRLGSNASCSYQPKSTVSRTSCVKS